jgi:hypothetical protein
MRLALSLTLSLVVGCGSTFTATNGSDVGGDDASADGDDALGEAAPPEARTVGDTGARDGAAEAEPDADGDGGVHHGCVSTVYYLDGDGDGYGGTTTKSACAAPDAGTWVTKGGDCDDSNATVHPGQSAYFSQGYVPTGKVDVSFDYDCDGQESESGNAPKASCQVVNLACAGSGYLEADPVRSGAGVDPFCGSAASVDCAYVNLACKAGAPQQASPIACH